MLDPLANPRSDLPGSTVRSCVCALGASIQKTSERVEPRMIQGLSRAFGNQQIRTGPNRSRKGTPAVFGRGRIRESGGGTCLDKTVALAEIVFRDEEGPITGRRFSLEWNEPRKAAKLKAGSSITSGAARRAVTPGAASPANA